MLEFIIHPNRTEVTVPIRSGWNGSLLAAPTFEGDFAFPHRLVEQSPDGVETFQVRHDRRTVEVEGRTVYLWASDLVARSTGGDGELWRVPGEVALRNDGTSYIQGASVLASGSFRDDGLQVLVAEQRYAWEGDIRGGTGTMLEISLRDASTGEVHWRAEPTNMSGFHPLGPEPRDITLLHDGETRRVEIRDGADFSVQNTFGNRSLGFEPTGLIVGTADGSPILEVRGSGENGTETAVGIRPDGTVVWRRDRPDLPGFRELAGVSDAEDGTLVGFGSLDLECESHTFTLRGGAYSLADGQILADRQVTVEYPDGGRPVGMVSPSSGQDWTGDGASDIVAGAGWRATDAAYTESAGCGYIAALPYGQRSQGSLRVWSTERNETVARRDARGTHLEPPGVFMIRELGLAMAARHGPDPVPTDRFAYYRYNMTMEANTRSQISDLGVASYRPEESVWNNRTMEIRAIEDPPEGATIQRFWRQDLRAAPGAPDRVMISWTMTQCKPCIGDAETDRFHARAAVYVADGTTAEPVWSHLTEAPLDVMIEQAETDPPDGPAPSAGPASGSPGKGSPDGAGSATLPGTAAGGALVAVVAAALLRRRR